MTHAIEGHELSFPTEFRAGASLMGLFVVPSAPARRLVDATPFRVAEVAPGRAVVSLNCVHYTDTDCGAYDEIAWAVFVERFGPRPRAPRLSTWRDLLRGHVPSYSWRLAVTTTLSRDAGRQLWGFPKRLADVRWEDGANASMSWVDGDVEVMRFGTPTRGARRIPRMAPPVYSMIDGLPHVGRLTQSYEGVGVHRPRRPLVLGDHEVADELRALGLPRRPVVALSSRHLRFRMSEPRPLGAAA